MEDVFSLRQVVFRIAHFLLNFVVLWSRFFLFQIGFKLYQLSGIGRKTLLEKSSEIYIFCIFSRRLNFEIFFDQHL